MAADPSPPAGREPPQTLVSTTMMRATMDELIRLRNVESRLATSERLRGEAEQECERLKRDVDFNYKSGVEAARADRNAQFRLAKLVAPETGGEISWDSLLVRVADLVEAERERDAMRVGLKQHGIEWNEEEQEWTACLEPHGEEPYPSLGDAIAAVVRASENDARREVVFKYREFDPGALREEITREAPAVRATVEQYDRHCRSSPAESPTNQPEAEATGHRGSQGHQPSIGARASAGAGDGESPSVEPQAAESPTGSAEGDVLERWAAPRAPETRCDTTLTKRRPREDCVCGTEQDDLGPCDTFNTGANGNCAFCEHAEVCHYPTRAPETARGEPLCLRHCTHWKSAKQRWLCCFCHAEMTNDEHQTWLSSRRDSEPPRAPVGEPRMEPRPVTYREMGMAAANPDAIVKCNCDWDAGHEPTCDIVAANRIMMSRGRAPETATGEAELRTCICGHGREDHGGLGRSQGALEADESARVHEPPTHRARVGDDEPV